MSDPFGLGKFADCKHRRLRCEQCGAVSDIRGWQAFSDYDELKDEIERLRATCLDASTRINEIMDRRDGELRGSAWGDLDNLRLDLGLAADSGGRKQLEDTP